MQRSELLPQLLAVVFFAGSSPASSAGAGSAPCVPLASISQAQCPLSWTAALVDKTSRCGKREDADVSTTPCRGFLRYHHHFFDGGHDYCLYDPSSLVLRGYYGFDRKANNDGVISCGMSMADFEDKECARALCR
jgi:hypothetical protein